MVLIDKKIFFCLDILWHEICVFCGVYIYILKLSIDWYKMRSNLYSLIKKMKCSRGNSLMEFAVTTAMMAILAATAAPKLSMLSENAKMQKSRNELDKISRQALTFFQDKASVEGRGRFPGQEKYNVSITGAAHSNSSVSVHKTAVLADLITNGGTFDDYRDSDGADWVSVFGASNTDHPAPSNANIASDDAGDAIGKNEWLELFGGEPIGSPYQDGHYVYQVVAGSGSGSKSESPILYIADLENPSQMHYIIQP